MPGSTCPVDSHTQSQTSPQRALHHWHTRTALKMQAFKPDLLISAGTAGGFKAQGGAIGDVYISKAVMHHDRRIPIPVGARPTAL